MICIRPATRSDAPTLVDFQVRMAAETEGMTLDPQTVTLGVAALFDHPERGQYYMAEEDGSPAGCLLTIPEWSDWRNGTVLWIHSVYVRPEFRRRGVFRAFYASLRRKVESDPTLKGLRLYVDKRNTSAQNTYTAMGMNGEHYQLFEWLK
jgi:GNAT superfamily N-acetyltransferase